MIEPDFDGHGAAPARLLSAVPAALFVGGLLAAGLFVAACTDGEPASTEMGPRSALELVDNDPGQLGSVAPFRFSSSDGRTVSERDLAGEVWIADFFFTTCSGPCPLITAQMRKLQDELAGTQVRMVSISVDPATDTPQVLADYAARVGADLSRWWFLTGDEQATYELIRSSFALPVERVKDALVGFQVSHATRLVVVDGKGKVRGYYAGDKDEGRAMARTRALWLVANGGS